jgi:hypothetical protein
MVTGTPCALGPKSVDMTALRVASAFFMLHDEVLCEISNLFLNRRLADPAFLL